MPLTALVEAARQTFFGIQQQVVQKGSESQIPFPMA